MKLRNIKNERQNFEAWLMWNKKYIQNIIIPYDMYICATGGSVFWYFRCGNTDDDPPIYFYDPKNIILYEYSNMYSFKVSDRLSDWLMYQLLDPISFVREAAAKQHILLLEPEERMPIPTTKFSNKRVRLKSIVVDVSQVPMLDSDFGDKLLVHYRQLQQTLTFFTPGEFVGLGLQEIKQIANAQGVSMKKLPLAFREYLRVMGASDGNIFRGADRGLQALLTLKTGLREMMQPSAEIYATPKLPKDAVVFLVYQGVQFFWFEAQADNDDPPVMVYVEGETEFLQVAERLSVWLWTQAEDPLAILEDVFP
jgi:hypothetical protein